MMRNRTRPMQAPLLAGFFAGLLAGATAFGQDRDDWLHWRGPLQTGVSLTSELPESITLGGKGELWTYPLAGRGTPVIQGDRLYTLGYAGKGAALNEVLICLDTQSGERLWEYHFRDFLSDVIYDRYSIGSPTIDPETGNVHALSTAGELAAFTSDGRLLWQRSMQGEFGRLTFPNGRTGAPVVDGDRVIIHVISAHWGPVNGPARDRFYAFCKYSGDLIWSSTPGVAPKDSSFAAPFLSHENGRRVLYCGTGCGNLVCIDTNTGEPLWRFQFATGGVNSAVMRLQGTLIAVHGKENVDSSQIGRMIALRVEPSLPGDPKEPLLLDKAAEVWRNDLCAFSSSPVLAGRRIFVTTATGDLCCVDADSGQVLWEHKLAPDQIHASPLFAEGKLYVPMNNGSFHVIRPGDSGPEVLSSVQLEGNCLGAPAAAHGRLYVHTTEKLYCFGKPETGTPQRAAPTRLQIVPSDVLLRPGQSVRLRVRGLGALGQSVAEGVDDVKWSVKGPLALSFTPEHELRVAADGPLGVGFVTASAQDATGQLRVRVVPNLPYREDFEQIPLKPPPGGEGQPVGPPPSHWIGAMLKFDVRELDGNQVLAKTLDRTLFQRAMPLIGATDLSNYTVQVDIRSDGSRRSLSTGGIIHQRYMILLKGNHQEIEISSNMERLKETVPFQWERDSWYTLKTKVTVDSKGTGLIQAKAWQRDQPEPEAWNLEVTHENAHTHGPPGLVGFAPQSRFRVYLDNLQVIPNE